MRCWCMSPPYVHHEPTLAKGLSQGIITVLRESWDLVTRVISKVTILITTHNPN